MKNRLTLRLQMLATWFDELAESSDMVLTPEGAKDFAANLRAAIAEAEALEDGAALARNVVGAMESFEAAFGPQGDGFDDGTLPFQAKRFDNIVPLSAARRRRPELRSIPIGDGGAR